MDGALASLGDSIERADVAAGIIEAHLHLLLEDPWADEHVACRSMLQLLEAPVPQRALSRQDVLAFAVDRGQPSSIAALFGAAREHALRAHDVIPAELWESLNTTRSRAPRKVADDRVNAFISWVRERSALAVGIVDTGMRQDAAWHRFTLGRSLARADATARLLSARPPGAWITVLRASGVHPPRAKQAATGVGTLELLVHDERYPRSILYTLAQAIDCLRALDLDAEPLERVRAGLLASPPPQLLPHLGDRMTAVRRVLSDAGSSSR